ncbi:hypothetical protein MOUN0_H02564 [Monosporozyma unispora]|nr:hypothetical protein C6P44_004479 [Kazachstania unispora]
MYVGISIVNLAAKNIKQRQEAIMAYVKNPNLLKLIDELQQDPVDDNELLKSLKEPSKNLATIDTTSVNSSLNLSSIIGSITSNNVDPVVEIATRVQNNSNTLPIENKKNDVRSVSAHPNIPMLPSKETLDYARRISEQLGNTSITSRDLTERDLPYREQMLTLTNNVPGVRRNHTNYSSIGSGNLASESGTSHVRYDTESEHEHEHFHEKQQDEMIDNSQMTIPPPRNKNRPKSHLYLSDGMEGDGHTEPPSITIQDVDNLEIRVVTGDKFEHDIEQDSKTNTYLQRPVPETPVETNDDKADSVDPDLNEDSTSNLPFAQQQQQNINTLSQLISITNDTTVGTEFNQLEIPKDERILLEQFIDALSRLTADLLLDPSRRMESLRRLRSAARALEGF